MMSEVLLDYLVTRGETVPVQDDEQDPSWITGSIKTLAQEAGVDERQVRHAVTKTRKFLIEKYNCRSDAIGYHGDEVHLTRRVAALWREIADDDGVSDWSMIPLPPVVATGALKAVRALGAEALVTSYLLSTFPTDRVYVAGGNNRAWDVRCGDHHLVDAKALTQMSLAQQAESAGDGTLAEWMMTRQGHRLFDEEEVTHLGLVSRLGSPELSVRARKLEVTMDTCDAVLSLVPTPEMNALLASTAGCSARVFYVPEELLTKHAVDMPPGLSWPDWTGSANADFRAE